MLYGSAPPPGQPYRDGYLTGRQTFQKYFTQNELKEFVESVLDTEVIAVGPGIMFVFADKGAELRFLYGRQRSHHALKFLGYRRAQEAHPRGHHGLPDANNKSPNTRPHRRAVAGNADPGPHARAIRVYRLRGDR